MRDHCASWAGGIVMSLCKQWVFTLLFYRLIKYYVPLLRYADYGCCKPLSVLQQVSPKLLSVDVLDSSATLKRLTATFADRHYEAVTAVSTLITRSESSYQVEWPRQYRTLGQPLVQLRAVH